MQAESTGGSESFDEYLARVMAKQKAYLGLEDKPDVNPMDVLTAAGRSVDSVTQAPVRAGIGAAQSDATDIEGIVKAMAAQAGANPDTAPSGADIIEKAGVDPAWSKYLGPAAEIGVPDPTDLMRAAKFLPLFPAMMGGIKKVTGTGKTLESVDDVGKLAKPVKEMTKKELLEAQKGIIKNHELLNRERLALGNSGDDENPAWKAAQETLSKQQAEFNARNLEVAKELGLRDVMTKEKKAIKSFKQADKKPADMTNKELDEAYQRYFHGKVGYGISDERDKFLDEMKSMIKEELPKRRSAPKKK